MDSKVIIWIFVIVIVAAAILYLAGYFLRKKNQEKLDALEERKIALFDLPVLEELDEIKKMHLVGQSQNTFREWNQKWQDLSTTGFANFESQIFDAESMNETFRLFQVKTATSEVENTLVDMEKEVETIRKGLKELRESEEKNSLDIQHALDVYGELKVSVKDEETTFGPALPEIKKQLKNIDKEFTNFNTLNTAGDPVEAKAVLAQAEEKTFQLEALMKRIPAYYEELAEVFPEQMKEINATYDKLIKEEYVFPNENLQQQIKEVNQAIQDNLKDLEKLELDSVEKGNKQLADTIDDLYDVLQKEMEAKVYVDDSRKNIGEFLAHAEKNNRQLLISLDHISQSYTLNHNELGTARSFQTQIDELMRQNNDIKPKVEEHELPYSEVAVFYKNAFASLDDIENQQVEISQGLQQLRQGEKDAQEKMDTFEFKLRNLKRYVEKQRLPGLPGDYLEFFFRVTDEVEDLSTELSDIRVDMDEVNHLSQLIEEDLVALEEKTHELVDAAALTEEMMQYANRYRHSHGTIKEAIDEALILFSRDFAYQEALDEIGAALEKVEPGAFKKVEAFYYQQKDKK